jgi:hypothetical protein
LYEVLVGKRNRRFIVEVNRVVFVAISLLKYVVRGDKRVQEINFNQLPNYQASCGGVRWGIQTFHEAQVRTAQNISAREADDVENIFALQLRFGHWLDSSARILPCGAPRAARRTASRAFVRLLSKAPWRSLPEHDLKQRHKPAFGKDKRRKHRHWRVTISYRDGEKFARVYTDRAKATSFAARQKKSPVVKATSIMQVGR